MLVIKVLSFTSKNIFSNTLFSHYNDTFIYRCQLNVQPSSCKERKFNSFPYSNLCFLVVFTMLLHPLNPRNLATVFYITLIFLTLRSTHRNNSNSSSVLTILTHPRLNLSNITIFRTSNNRNIS